MSGASRKVKNPLLTAAGEGFPFDNFAETALLVPVTPATPAVLRDDAELDSFVGQEPINQKTSTDADNEFTPIPLNSDENKNSVNQPAKQGYFTSILSSLPNLSLSSITGDSPGSQTNRQQEHQSSNPYVPSHEPRDSLRDTSPPIIANFHDPRRTNFVGSAEGSTGSVSAPPQPTLPPTLPSSTNGPISYRLGNQRRLKYAPPPDLTSNTSKQYSTPVVQSAFVPQSVAVPTIFNPNQIGSPSQTYESVPTTQNYQSVPLTQAYQSVPATQNHQPVPSTQSYQSTISTQSYKSVSPIQSNQSIPSTEIQQSVPSIQDYQSVPLIQSTQPVLSTQSHQSVSLTQSYKPVSLSQDNQPVQLNENNQFVPLTQSYQSITSTGSFQPISSTQNYHSNASTQSSKSVSPTSSKQPTPSPQSYQSVSLTQTYQSVSSSQSSQPISSTQSHQPVPLTQSNQFIKPSVATSSPSIQHSTPELSESNSQQESFRASPLTTGSVDPSRRISQNQNPTSDTVSLSEKPRVSLSSSQPIFSEFPEPATPQNTPANVSFFGFDGYTSKRDSSRTPNLEKEANNSSTRSDSILKQNVTQSTAEKKPTVTFGPVSAVQVSEKLEHLLAEQKEDLSTKPDRSEAEDQAVGSPSIVKSDNIRENSDSPKVDTLSNPIASQEASRSNLSHQESSGAHEKIDASQSDGVSSQQYFQTQSFPSSADFFADQTSNLNTFSEALNTFTPPASTFFNTNVDLSTSSLRNDLQQVPLTTSFVSHPRNPWDSNQASMVETCSSSTSLPQPPLFYNPAQFPTELQEHISTHQFYGSPVVNQTQGYFDNLPGLVNTQEIPGGIGSAFLPSVVMTTVPEPTGSATLSPVQMSINPLAGRTGTDGVPTSFQNLAAGPSDKRMQYRAVYHHWFYRKEVEHKVLWLPFSMQDSLRLEEVYNSTEITPETTVATDGCRYDVDILRRQRSPVYWSGKSTEVRRCSWFYKGPTESRYVPYDESTALKLEEEYKQACITNNWNRRIDLNNGEYIIFHSATVQVHYLTPSSQELVASWGNSTGSEDSAYLQGGGSRPRVIKRGMDEFHIEDGEPEKVDHLLFLVHGIGSVCDLKFRTVEEVVDEFRSISLQLVQSHYRTASEQRVVNRIEVLPISWHATLHSEDTGIDKKLQAITLESIPKLRHFTNDTLLDILFYTSPVYCQTIMQTVGIEINRLYTLFQERNPDFNGGIYLGGHSLGSLILFDLLCHQTPLPKDKSNEDNQEANEEQKNEETDPSQPSPNRILKRSLSKKISYVMGVAGTGQPYIHYPQLNFHPRAFFALGSPIGMFVTVRGIDMLGEDFILPTCPAFFNIFHPFDPVAYRVEALINPEANKYRPMLIPHHKGRKRMHLELKETMARVGADLKQKVIDSVKNTWNSVYQLALFHRSDNTLLEREIDKVVEEQLQQTPPVTDQQNNDDGGAEIKIGKLNGGRRIDYVLQEAPFEYINEYIFALTSHVCYWESEDTMLMILKEIYGSAGIQTDAQLPQQTLSIERTSPSMSVASSTSSTTNCEIRPSVSPAGMDPTAPIPEKMVGPPPKAGFVRKS
ncbi:SEC23-interacting protein-like isoform X1 [Osmia bicornis bicornis]|uniref:SEC23-interacting protein-like isoform X1 n=1 Tax=Osmia bicornis bicornis TaxID=1437191 RepID=UPI001EAF6C04|nr:SEC23-interacting protein-like isoform X1 [Osmia bicornis bicornis]